METLVAIESLVALRLAWVAYFLSASALVWYSVVSLVDSSFAVCVAWLDCLSESLAVSAALSAVVWALVAVCVAAVACVSAVWLSL